MWTRSPVQGIFGRSPFKPIQEHMKVVDACASETPALFEALAAGDKSGSSGKWGGGWCACY